VTAIYNGCADIRQNSESQLFCKLRYVIEDLIKDCIKYLEISKCLMIEVKISFINTLRIRKISKCVTYTRTILPIKMEV
jgi:hypothetical protein